MNNSDFANNFSASTGYIGIGAILGIMWAAIVVLDCSVYLILHVVPAYQLQLAERGGRREDCKGEEGAAPADGSSVELEERNVVDIVGELVVSPTL